MRKSTLIHYFAIRKICIQSLLILLVKILLLKLLIITLHTISNQKVNYHENHHLAMIGLTFKNSNQEDVKDYAAKHLEEMKKFNEQLSTITGELT